MKRKINPLVLAINEGIASRKAEMRDSRSRIAQLTNERKFIVSKYAPVFALLRNDSSYSIWVSMTRTKPTIQVTLSALDGFKDARLTNMFEAILDIEPSAVIEEKEWAQYGLNRDYHVTCNGVYVDISAYVRDDSPTCKRVPVSTRMEEVTQYQIVCE